MVSRINAADDVQAVHNAVKFMGESLDDGGVVHTVRCGLHSGFRLCCVVFFVKVMGRWFDEDGRAGYRRIRGASRANYFACPRCLIERTFVKPKRCGCGAECDAHLGREVQRIATARHARAGWVDKILDGIVYEKPVDDETQGAVERGYAAWDAATVARHALPNRADRTTRKRRDKKGS